MKKIVLNKKIILIVLTVILLVILVSNYIKTADHSLLELFNKDKSSADELFFNKKKKGEEEEKVVQAKNQQRKEEKMLKESKKQAAGVKEKAEKKEIKSIALISEIKDPFAISAQAETKAAKIELNSKNQQRKELIFLEKNIIAEKIKFKDKSAAELFQNDKKNDSVKLDSEEKKQKEQLQKIKLPFKLLGIIKNENSASALFLYQGKNILKQEKDKIDIFKIEAIKKQEITISYQNETIKISLWKEEVNEN